MKKRLHFSLILSIALLIISCGKEKKASDNSAPASTYSIDADHSKVQWTAFKTTAKVPVKGTFKEIKINKSVEGASASSALEGLEFEIPVSSIFSKDTIRDAKLNKFFFAVMENTLSLKGSFKIGNENSGTLALTMNGLTKEIPFNYEMSQDTILINAPMDLNNWQAQAALESLNQACLELHTGPDGVSKTWNEVVIDAKILTVRQ
jgi:polyisoprenoid-binding protein YceI